MKEDYTTLQKLYAERAKLLNAIFRGENADENRRKLDELRARLEAFEKEVLTRTQDRTDRT